MTALLAPALAALVLASGTTAPAPRAEAAADARVRRQAYELELARLVPAPEPVEARGAGDLPATPEGEACGLLAPGATAAPVEACLGCHAGSGSGHPVGMAYGPAAARAGPRLRPAAEVVRAGVFLPDGELRCTTCHDGRSQVRFRLALPPGAELRAGVVTGDPSTYEARPALAAAALVPGTRVGTKPLCLACHAL